MISSRASGDRAVKNAEYPATRTTKSRYWSGCFFASSSVSRINDIVLNMPAFMHFEEGTQQHHQFLLIGLVLQRRQGSSFWFSSTPPRIEPVGSLPTELMTAVGPRWSVLEAGLAPSASGECALRPSGVAMVWAPNGTLARWTRYRRSSYRRLTAAVARVVVLASAHRYRSGTRALAGYPRPCHHRYHTSVRR